MDELNNQTDQKGQSEFMDDGDLLAWHDLMRFRKQHQQDPSPATTDLDAGSISAQASISADIHDEMPYTMRFGDRFMDSATDSGQTSDSDSRIFEQQFYDASARNRKQLIENLLHEIYVDDQLYHDELEETRYLVRRSSDASQSSIGRKNSVIDYTAWRIEYYAELSKTLQSFGYQGNDKLDVQLLTQMDTSQLKMLRTAYENTIMGVNRYLVQTLKQKDKRQIAQSKQYLIINSALQALAAPSSPEGSQRHAKFRFSVTPPVGDSDGYLQWIEAMRAVLKLPGGLPTAFRKTMWSTIANRYISQLPFEWEKIKKLLLHDRFNPDEEALGLQIVKDLHRTGCSGFCGEHNEKERSLLKRVLLAYARFRPSVGYCQGFNIIAAVILDVVDKDEEEALKIMIYLIEHVLPPNYFANDLEALTIDLSVFQELVSNYLPALSSHLDKLRKQSLEERGANGGYEPPLTNLFSIQWFLTLFATCLQHEATLRVWDCIFLYGSVILMKTALVLLVKLEKYFLPVETAFDFYSIMSELQQSILDGMMIGPEELIQELFKIPDFDLRTMRIEHTVTVAAAKNSHYTQFSPFRNKSPRSGFSPRRSLANVHGQMRRNSDAFAEHDFANLRKKYEESVRERLSPTTPNLTTATLMMRAIARRGTIFSPNDLPKRPDSPHVGAFVFPSLMAEGVSESSFRELTRELPRSKSESQPEHHAESAPVIKLAPIPNDLSRTVRRAEFRQLHSA
ncbi:TBC1 domain family member 30-like [Paramacrobiotus metropolitanus]|uniref:TBC1 domain family member 30-like n=1 Tax=Paramacrobiotus metropolitanus TaxID=2943436 RepID=UPI0024458664|nr:TBC1 domain family member 30-like [Paramacrobiotus metropolitanus]